MVELNYLQGLEKTVFIGYKDGTKGYLFYDIQCTQIFVSRNVFFYETSFPFKSEVESNMISQSMPKPICDNTVFFDKNEPIIFPNPEEEVDDSNHTTNPTSHLPAPQTPRHSMRQKRRPHYLRDYHCYMSAACNTDMSSGSNSSSLPYLLSSFLSYKKCSPNYRNFCYSVSFLIEPKTYTQDSKLDYWVQAMNYEIAALEQNHTWEIVDLPPNKRLTDCK